MQLFTLNSFTGRPMCIHNGWRFFENGIMSIEGKNGEELPFSKMSICEKKGINSSIILDGEVSSDGYEGLLRQDKKKLKNREMALLLIVAEGTITLPEHLYHDHRVHIEPVMSKDGSLVATIICFLKNEELVFVINDNQNTKEIFFEYDKHQRFPIATDISIPAHLNSSTFIKKSWWTKLVWEFKRRGYVLFYPFKPWKVP